MQNTIDNNKIPLSAHNDRYSISKPFGVELDRLAAHENGRSLVATDTAVKITDGLSRKEMILYGALPFDAEKKGGYNGSEYRMVTIDRLQLKDSNDAMLLAGIDVKRLEIPDSETYDIANGRSAGEIVPVFMAETQQVLQKENIAAAMAHRERQMRISVDSLSPKEVDQRDRLRSHLKLQEELAALNESYIEAAEDDETQLTMLSREGAPNEKSKEQYEFEQTKHKNAAVYRDKTMVANLMPENMMIVDGKLLTPDYAEAYTNGRYAAIDRNDHMPMGDIESKYDLVRAPIQSNEAMRPDADGDTLVGGTSFKDSSNNFYLYVVKDQDDLLWLRAKETDITDGRTIRENEDVFNALGVNPKTILQGVPVTDGVEYPTERRYMDAKQKEDRMMAQVSPNEIRKMVTRGQIENHRALSNNHLLDPSQPSALDQRDPKTETLSQAVVSAKYPVVKELSGSEFEYFKAHSDDTDRVIRDSDIIKKAFMVKDNTGETSMLVLASRGAVGSSKEERDNVLYVETFNQDGEMKDYPNMELMDIQVADIERSSVHSIRRGIEKLPRYSDEDKLKDMVELRGFGKPGEEHPALKKTQQPQGSELAQQAPDLAEPTRSRLSRP